MTDKLLLDLAERCEKATEEQQRALLLEAFDAVFLDDPEARFLRFRRLVDAGAYLDAAMTLVPDGYDWIIGRTNDGLTIPAEVGGRGDEYMRFGNTPALALCAAALRARSQDEQTGST